MQSLECQSSRKLRGGYYTPAKLVDFLVRYCAIGEPATILEPSCGDGAFFKGIASHVANSSATGFEIDAGEASKAVERAKALDLHDLIVHPTDFLSWAVNHLRTSSTRFDAVVGNPPFIRYQYLPSSFQHNAQQIFYSLGCHFTKHTNAWVPFVLASFALLRPGGRMAMVVPAEILHILHAQSLRTYMGTEAKRVVLVDPAELWFPDTLQGAVLLLAEKKNHLEQLSEGVGIYPVQGFSFLSEQPARVFGSPEPLNGKTVEGKWTRALLNAPARSLLGSLAELPEVHRFGDVADVDVGIVTGANKFFFVDDRTIERYGLEQWAHPMFGRSDQCPGVIYDDHQHEVNRDLGRPTNFLWFTDRSVEENSSSALYIKEGEDAALDRRYKCRIRAPWYSVPSVYATELGMLKRAHDMPRLILNKLNAFTTDTSYRVRIRQGTPAQLVYCFMNALTVLTAELEGRHYGGGVLELVPSEIENLRVPLVPSIREDLGRLDAAIRSASAEEILIEQGHAILSPLGVTPTDQHLLLSSWLQLRNRRQRTPKQVDLDTMS